jgi:RHS repeat-associated protein
LEIWLRRRGSNYPFLTQKERDNETGLDFFEARYFASTQGRFTSTDPIIMGPDRIFDPQVIDLYAYARNNPLKFTDPSGETINEPTSFQRERDRKRYEAWRTKFLSTQAGRDMWKRYDQDTKFTLNLVVTDRGSDDKNKSAETGKYTFDSAHNLNGATITLGNNLGSDPPGNAGTYPVLSTLTETDAAQLGASKLAHEFGHVEDDRSKGTAFYDEQNLLGQYQARSDELTNSHAKAGDRMTDPTLLRIERQFQQQVGRTFDQESLSREHAAERNAIPIIRQVMGKSLSGQTNRAMKRLQNGH